MNEFKAAQFIIVLIDAQGEEKTRISLVNYLMVSELKKVCHLAVSLHYVSMTFDLYPGPLRLIVSDVPPTKSCLALSVLQQNKSDLKHMSHFHFYLPLYH